VAVNGPTDPEFCFQAIDGTFTVPDIQVGPTAPGVLRGTVTAAGGAPLDGASVVVGGRVATTDGSGQYQVTGLPPQEYDVTVGHTGHQARVVPVTVVGGYAKDDFGVLKVRIAVRDQGTDTWLQPDGSWGAYRPLRAYSTDPGARRTVWKFKRHFAPGSYGVSLIVVDAVLQRNPPPRPWLVVTVQP